LGGGASKHFKKYADNIDIRAKIKPAKLLNEAGIIGAALWARDNYKKFYKKIKNL
jgi:polyphosphate glucokinase